MASTRRTGAFPGSFNPPTMAHLAIAAEARRVHRLDRIDLVVSRSALAKENVDHPRFEDRIAVLEGSVEIHPWLEVSVTELQLLVEIARGYDLLILGADKWVQIQDPVWYDGDEIAREDAMAGLPELAIVSRGDLKVPAGLRLEVPTELVEGVSSTRARAGELALMTEPARRFARETGAWIDRPRYERSRSPDETVGE